MTVPVKAARTQARLIPALLEALEAEVLRGTPLDVSLAEVLRRHREFGSRDRRLFSNLAFSWFRWRGWLRPIIEQYDRAAAGALAWLMDSDTMHPAISRLLDQSSLPARELRPLQGEPLETKARLLAEWAGAEEPFAIQELVPSWTEAQLVQPADESEFFHRCIEAFQNRPPVWVRCPSEPTSEPGPLPGARSFDDPRALRRFEKETGQSCVIQDLASQAVGYACAPRFGERWWDACAGSGGKALHLAALMHNRGRVLATDLRREPLRELRRRARRADAVCVRGTHLDATVAAPKGAPFDGILVDAPCSGMGTWARNADMRWRSQPEAIERAAALQTRLLHHVAGYLKHGGKLVYAVCTLTYKETTNVLDQFLRSHPEYTKEQPKLPGLSLHAEHWIWPWDGPCNGMFLAVLRRCKS